MSSIQITALFESLNAKSIVLLCHHNADPDAICSAFAFASLLKQVRPEAEVEIGAAQGISRLSKHLLRFLPIDVEMNPHVEQADVVVLLDTNTVQQLDRLADKIRALEIPIIVIDHHSAHPDTQKLAAICLTDEASSSTCEIIYNLYRETGQSIGPNEAKALFLGIAFDTRHFVLANSSTLKNIASLIDAGVNAQETLSLLSLPMDFSERVARLKGCRRTRLFRVGEYIVALSHVSAYQASAARALIEVGAHVAVVAGQKGESLEISMRANQEFFKKTGIHLGRDIAKPLGEFLGGMGGGHSTAAGVNGLGDVGIGMKRSLRILKERISASSQNQVATLK